MCGGIGKLVSSVFGGGSSKPKSQTVVQQMSTSAADILPSTESKEPEAPDLGGKNKRNKRQKKSLTIEKTPSSGSGGLNM